MSLEQIDILAGVDRKNFLNSQIASIHVYFDAGTAKHRLSVKFSEGISRVLAARKGCQAGTWGPEDPVRALGSLSGREVGPGFGAGPGNPPLGEVGPGIGRAGLFGHGGVTAEGPAPQSPAESPQTAHIVSIGPVSLDLRPLSAYQQASIDTILSLRAQGWSDRQIANHLNESGYLTPRGRKWLAQSVFSVRNKYRKRLERFGEKC